MSFTLKSNKETSISGWVPILAHFWKGLELWCFEVLLSSTHCLFFQAWVNLYFMSTREVLFSVGQQLVITFLCQTEFIKKALWALFKFTLSATSIGDLLYIFGGWMRPVEIQVSAFLKHPFLCVVSWTKTSCEYLSIQSLYMAKKIGLKTSLCFLFRMLSILMLKWKDQCFSLCQ